MAKLRTYPWDPAVHLETTEHMAYYLELALDDGDPALIAAVLGDIARAKGMSKIARKTGLGRESLYKALSAKGNPKLETILKVIDAVGLQFEVSPKRPIEKRSKESRQISQSGRNKAASKRSGVAGLPLR